MHHFDKDKLSTLCDVGFLKTVINRYAAKYNVELLVLGITGSTGIIGIVGSNASSVVSSMRIPTLIIPPESRFPSHPAITLATDYQTRLSSQDLGALDELIRCSGQQKLGVVYIGVKPDSAQVVSGEIQLRALLPQVKIDFNYLKGKDATKGITDFIKENHTDIICLVKHHHNMIYSLFTGSMVNRMISKSVRAILILHD